MPSPIATIEKRFSILVNCVKCRAKFRVNIDSFEDYKNYRLSLDKSDLCFYDCPHCDFVFIGTTNISIFRNNIDDEYDDLEDEEEYNKLTEDEDDDMFFERLKVTK